MYLLILIFPLLGAITAGLGGFYFGRYISIRISITCMFIAALIALFLYFEVCLSDSIVMIKLFTWLKIGLINLNFGLLFDNLTCIMLLIICWISFFVHLYSIEYMKKDPFLCRFMSYLSLFTFFMEILVTADNLIQMFIGWEGVGICSYLLINFWYSRILANKAALKAMIMNRISDIFFLIGILLVLWKFKTVDFLIIFDLISFVDQDIYFFLGLRFYFLDVIAFLFLIGAVGKSAQLGMHTWLPDAMEGPTPVSALLHAATMVTAGVFLILRCSVIF
jgi:NADH-quinone oxidoreductase subunit L